MTGNDTEFARWLGVNKSSVCRARKAGRLVLTADGRVEFEQSAARWHETAGGRTDVAARHAQKRGAAIPTPQPQQKNATAAQSAPAVPEIDAAAGSGMNDGDTRTKAKTLLLHYENAQIKLEMALRRGLRLDRSAVKRESAGLGAMLRAGIERVIDQTAPRLAAAGNELERRRILAGEIQRLRWIFRRELPRALRRSQEAGAAGKAVSE